MHEPEVQPLVTLSLRSLKIRQLLRRRQLLPLLVLALIPPDVILLDTQVQKEIVSGDGDKDGVASSCEGLQCQQKIKIPSLSFTQ